MKKLLVLIVLMMIGSLKADPQARMLPAHYSNLAGRIIVAPRVQLNPITPKEAHDMHTLQMLEREKAIKDLYIADHRNDIIRDWANKRTIKREYGSDSLYHNNPKEVKTPMATY